MVKEKKESKKTILKKKKPIKKENVEEEELILTPKEIKEREDKQLKWTLVIIGIIFLSALVPYFVAQASKTFHFAGVDWQIQHDGDKQTGITWYATQFGKYYKGDYYGAHSVYLRNDPRKNQVLTEVGNFSFKKNWIYSFSQDIFEYDEQVLGTMELGKITQAIPFIESVSLSANNETYATENNFNYTICDNKPASATLIEVKLGEQNKIYINEKDCYVLELEKIDDYLLVVERFVIEIIKQLNE